MSKKLRQFLHEHYALNGYRSFSTIKNDTPIQIDDQDDTDSLTEFCNIFVTVGRKNKMEIEFSGGFPITQQLADFAEIYCGIADPSRGRLVLTVTPKQIEALTDLANRIRDSAQLGHTVGNSNWHRVSARTISSLYRFVRIVKEYQDLRASGLL